MSSHKRRPVVRRSHERPTPAAPTSWRPTVVRVARTFWQTILAMAGIASLLLFGNAWVVCLAPAHNGLEDVCAAVDHFYWDWTVGLASGQTQPEGLHLTGAHFIMAPILCVVSLGILSAVMLTVDSTLDWWERMEK